MFYLELHTEKEVGRVGFETVLLEYGTSNVHQLVNEETKLFLVVTLLEAENDSSRSVLFFSLIQHFTNRVSQLYIIEFTSSDIKGTSSSDEIVNDDSFPSSSERHKVIRFSQQPRSYRSGASHLTDRIRSILLLSKAKADGQRETMGRRREDRLRLLRACKE